MFIKNSFEIRYIIKSILLIEFIFLNYIKLYFLYLIEEIEFRKIEYYLTICNENKQKKNIFYKNQQPLISIISPVFNREHYISRFIKSIQNQNFDNIELILVDDNSNDNSIKKIENYEKEDERIVLIKNKKNKGTLISRNLGVLYSKGQYLILPDPDDLICKNILKICYKYAVKYKIDIIRFNAYNGNGRIFFRHLSPPEKKPIYQPILKSYLFYGKGELVIIDYLIHNKLIKRDAFIRALNILNNFYFNLYMIFSEDVLMNYSLYLTAKSFLFLKQIGYLYIKNNKSITRNLINKLRLKDFFIRLKFIFEYYKNTKYERDISNTILKNINNNFFIINSDNIAKFEIDELIIYYKVLNKYLNCIFITDDNKKIIENIIKLIEIKIKKYKK